MATAARPAWVEGGDLDGAGGGRVTPAAVSARRTPTGPEHHGVPSGSQTERTRGRHGGRARRRHFATTRSRFAQQMEQRQVGATLDNMSLETEAHINRKLAEMQQRDLASVNRLAGKLRKDYDRLRVQSASKAQELRAVQEQLMRLERLGSGGGPDTRSQEGPAGAIALAEQKLEDTRQAYEDALRRREMYNFMAARLKSQTMVLDKEAKGLQELLAVTRQDKEQACLNLHAGKQERAAAEAMVAKLQRKLEKGRQARSDKLERFDTTIEEQEEKRKAMEVREARRVEIAKLAQGDLNEEGEDRLKQLFLVRKIYSSMLLSKLQDHRKRTDKLEDAFQRIRSATGLTDVDAIVEKFLTRDETNERLSRQMVDARQRIEDLRATHVRLQQLLDAQNMVKETTHENRKLYHKVDDFDRRLTEARHMSEEAKQRSFKIMITLEESRACIAKLLNKLDFDPAAQAQGGHSRRPTASARSSRSASGASGAAPVVDGMVDGCKVQDGRIVVGVEDLPVAINLLDQRLTKYLEIVAAIFEKEEQLASHSKPGEEGGVGVVRRMSLTSAKEVINTVATSGPSLLNNLSARQQPAAGGTDTAAARRSTLSMLAGKASDRVYRSMMDIQPDTSSANLRVRPGTTPTMPPPTRLSHMTTSEEEEDGDEYLAGLAEAAGLDGSAGSAMRHGRQTGVVVQRESLKRLSAMLSDRRSRNKQHRHAGRKVAAKGGGKRKGRGLVVSPGRDSDETEGAISPRQAGGTVQLPSPPRGAAPR